MKHRILILFAGLVGQSLGWAQSHDNLANPQISTLSVEARPDGGSFGAELAPLIERALKANPALQSLQERWLAAQQVRSQKVSLPNPKITLGHYIREVETRVGAQSQSLQVMQPIPWPGRLIASGAVASKQAEVAGQAWALEADSVANKVVQLSAKYYEWHGIRKVLSENLELLTLLEQQGQAALKVNKLKPGALLQLHVKLGMLQDQLVMWDAREPSIRASLNALLDRPSDAQLSPLAKLPSWESKSRNVWLANVSRARSLKLAEAQAAAAQSMKSLTSLNRMPDIGLGLTYIRTDDAIMANVMDSGKDPMVVALSFTVPLWEGKNRAQRKQSHALARAAALQARATARNLEHMVSGLHSQFEDSVRRHLFLSTELLPKAKEAFGVSQQAFAIGKLGAADMIQAQQQLLAIQRQIIETRVKSVVQNSQLQFMTGGYTPAPGDGDIP